MLKFHSEITQPIFLKCCQYTVDKFWDKIFDDLAYGKMPFGVYFSRGFLCCSGKTTECVQVIEHQNPKLIHDKVYNFLNEKVGILSPTEKLNKQKEVEIIGQQNKDKRCNWVDIKKKNVKDLLIERFATNMKSLHNLTIKQTQYLISVIGMALMFKSITSKHIEMNDMVIQNIEGITFKKCEIIFDLDLYNTDSDKSMCSQEINKKSMIDHWVKYLFELNKKS